MSLILEATPVPFDIESVSVRVISAPELITVITDLVDAFTETVNNGSPLGFMPPISRDESRDYWISLLPELRAGRRVLLVAMMSGAVVGSAQLLPSRRGNSPHRAEIEKVFVTPSARGQGVGTALMNAVEDLAVHYGRTLLLLNTRVGEPPHRWYKELGYRDVGVIPGWTIGPDGESYDHVTMYKNVAIGARRGD